MLVSLQIASSTRSFVIFSDAKLHLYIENQKRTSPWLKDWVLFIFGEIVNIYTNLSFDDSFLHILDQIGYTWLIRTFSDSIWYVLGETTNLITL